VGDDFRSASVEENWGGKFKIRNSKSETGGEKHKILNPKHEKKA
jgi:hypothetical protein